jgi:hypothetical protein
MRLSAVSEQDEERAENVLHAALDGGVTLLDTADVYGRSDGDVGHNERLVAAALRRRRAVSRGPEGAGPRMAAPSTCAQPAKPACKRSAFRASRCTNCTPPTRACR